MIHDKLDGLMTPVEKIARVANAGLIAATAPQTAPSGAISLDNADGTRTIIGEVVNGESNPSYTMATHVGDTTPPGIPTGITATSKSGVVVVEWDGTLEGGIPDDFFCVRIYLDGTELGALTEAGSVASAKLDGGTTVLVTATSEDDCCLADGTPDHNVSAASQAISVTVTSSAEEIIVDVEEEIEGVQQEISDFKREVAADYYKSKYIDDNFSTVEEVGAVYRDSMARNLSPFYSHDFTDVYDAENPEGYWYALDPNFWTKLEDAWGHCERTADASAVWANYYVKQIPDVLKPSTDYTFLVEWRNATIVGDRVTIAVVTDDAGTPDAFAGGTKNTGIITEPSGYRLIKATTLADLSQAAIFTRGYVSVPANCSFSGDVRVSIYEGEYTGAYKPYNADTANLTRDYATKTWTEQTAEDYSIGAAQRYTATIANPNLTPFYAHDLTDVYDATTNPNGYWTETPANATQLSDGWAHIALPNEGGTGTMYSRTYVRPMESVPNSATLMIEIRNLVTNVTSQTTAPRLWFNASASNSQMWRDVVYFVEGGTYRLALVKTNNANPTHFARWWWGIEKGGTAEFDARISIYENATDSEGEPITYAGNFKPYVTGQDALSKEYATQSQLKVGIEGISLEVSEKYATKAVGAPNLNPFFAHDFLDIYNATTNPGGWWRGSVQRDFATQLKDGWARVVIDNTSGTATLARAFRFGASPNLKDGGKYTCLVEMRNILSKPTSATIYTQQGTDVQFWGDHKYDGWTVYWNQVEGDTHVEYKQMKRVEAVSRQTTGTCCFSMNVQVPAGQKADFEIRLSLFENATDSEGETIPYDGPYKPYVTDQQALSKEYATQSQLTVGIDGIRTEVSRDYQTKAAMGDYSTTAQMNTAIAQSAQSITSTVAATYETQSHANTTYSTKTELQQTASGLDTRIAATEDGITLLDTLIRLFQGGVLAGYVGNAVSALMNAAGSFDVVQTTWQDGEPTIVDTLATFGANLVEIGKNSASAVIDFCAGGVRMAYDSARAGFTILSSMRIYLLSEGNSTTNATLEATSVDEDTSVSRTASINAHASRGAGSQQIMLEVYEGNGATEYQSVALQSTGFRINNGTSIKGVYFGTKILNPNNSATMTLFTATECQSMFGRALDQTKDVIIVQNGDTGAYQGQITGATNASGALMASINPTKSGPIRYQYIVILGA